MPQVYLAVDSRQDRAQQICPLNCLDTAFLKPGLLDFYHATESERFSDVPCWALLLAPT